MRERDEGLLDYILENHTPGEDLGRMRRYLWNAHYGDLVQVRDHLPLLYDEVSIIAGDILEIRKERECDYERTMTLEEALKGDDINMEVLLILLESATDEELERITATMKGAIADEAAEILKARSVEESEPQEEEPGDDGPEDDLEEVED